MSKFFFVFCIATRSLAWTYDQKIMFDAKATVTVELSQEHQTMVGAGCSGAFQRARDLFGRSGLSPQKQKEAIQFLFDPELGSLNILRNGIGSSPNSTKDWMNSILPVCPATPDGPFNYTFDNDDSAQLALSKAALSYNPGLIVYADAWSAPGCMKTVGVDSQGGMLCGVRGTNCSSGDWRQAYSDYIVQYIRFYEQQGIQISAVGAFNEPDFNPITYASMLSDGFQAKDLLEVLYPTVKAAFPNVDVACCDETGARQGRTQLYELQTAGGSELFDIYTYHNYQSTPKTSFDTPKQNWQTEWADGGAWNPNWDVVGHLSEGLNWALYIHNALVHADTSAYLHWQCAESSPTNAGLIRLAGDSYEVAARLWATAGYFRFTKPGAKRIEASSSVEEVYVSAFKNTNGTLAIPIINAARFAYNVTIDLKGGKARVATPYLTDNNHNVSRMADVPVHGSNFNVMVEPRAMKTFFLH